MNHDSTGFFDSDLAKTSVEYVFSLFGSYQPCSVAPMPVQGLYVQKLILVNMCKLSRINRL